MAFSTHDTSGLSPQGLFNSGILESKPGSLIKVYVCRCVTFELLTHVFVDTECPNIITVARSARVAAVFCKT
jgi:hypothetical protein